MKILVVCEHLPAFDRSGADLRLMQVLKELCRQEHRVTLVARSAGPSGESDKRTISDLGVTVFAQDAERLLALGKDRESDWKFEDVLRSGDFEAAVLTLWFWNGISIPEHYLQAIREVSPKTRVAILTDDVFSLREFGVAGITGAYYDWERAHNFKQREEEICNHSDFVIAISKSDQAHLKALTYKPVAWLPMPAETPTPSPRPFHERSDFLFLGDFSNFATRDAAQWFLRNAWPLIGAAIPDAKLYVLGNGSLDAAVRVDERVIALGSRASLGEFLDKARVFVSPLRLGTGMSTRSLTALASGLPIVAGPYAPPGIPLESGVNCFLAASATEFANAAVAVYQDPVLWSRLSQNGLAVVRENFSKDVFARQLALILDELSSLKASDEPYFPSCMEVEKYCPMVVDAHPPHMRWVLRNLKYFELARSFLSQSRPNEALRQARNIFSFIPTGTSLPPVLVTRYLAVLRIIEQCYMELADSGGLAKCREVLMAHRELAETGPERDAIQESLRKVVGAA